MASAFTASGFAYLCFAFAAHHLSIFLDPQRAAGTGTATLADAALVLLDSAGEVLPPFAGVVVLIVAVALIYHHLSRRQLAAAAPVAGAAENGRRAISGLLMFVLCVSVGTLELTVFGFGRGQAAGGGGGGGAGHGAQAAQVLGLAALRAMPAAATVTFFCGVMLIQLAGAAHVRAGAGGSGAVAADGPIKGLILRVLPKVAAAAAAALVGLMAVAFVCCSAKY